MRLGALCLGLTLRTIVQSASPRQEISQIRSHNKPQSKERSDADWGYQKFSLSETVNIQKVQMSTVQVELFLL